MPNAPIFGAAAVRLGEIKARAAAAYSDYSVLAQKCVAVTRRCAAATRRGFVAFRQRNRVRIKIAVFLSSVALPTGALAGFAALLLYVYYGIDLPDHKQLATYEPAAVTQVDA